MKPELNLETKKAFFACYYGQNVLNGNYKVYYNSLKSINNRSFLLLKPLIEPFNDYSSSGYFCDNVRSKGYAYNWNGITVDEQISNGWIKLRTK